MDGRFWKSRKRRKSSPSPTRPTDKSATSPKPPVLNPATSASIVPSGRRISIDDVGSRSPVRPSATAPPPGIKADRLSKTQLWVQAYDAICKDDPELVSAYKTVLSSKLQPESACDIGERSDHDSEDARHHMDRLVQQGLRQTEKAAAEMDNIRKGIHVAYSVKELISTAAKHAPEAAAVWAGVCLLLEILKNPASKSKALHDGISYIISRMDWYWCLSKLLETTQAKTTEIQDMLKRHIGGLYKKLLSHQMKSVCSFYRGSITTIACNMVKIDDWAGALQSVKDAETTVQQDIDAFNNWEVRELLNYIWKQARNQHSQLRYICRDIQDKTRECLAHLRLTDPHDDMKRIADRKGGLFRGASDWILCSNDFRRWQEADDAQLLWIKGNPGKGKTMLMITIVEELERQQRTTSSTALSYFFCQGTDENLNHAVAVLRGLIFLLCLQQPLLASHLLSWYHIAGVERFRDAKSFYALSKVLKNILQDEHLQSTYLVVDALDECIADQDQLLRFIASHGIASPRVKWIISSRNIPKIENLLKIDRPNGSPGSEVRLSLEVTQNAHQVALAVNAFIDHRLSTIGFLQEDHKTRGQVRDIMRENANGTFLWVALVADELQKTNSWDILEALEELLEKQEGLYGRTIQQIRNLERKTPEFTPSEQQGSSGKDSGYASLESAGKAVEAGDDAGSNYSAESILPALTDGYVTTVSNRLARDIGKHSFLSRIPEERLREWVRIFSLKLHGESSTRIQRDASVFIRKKRTEIIGELAGRSLPEPSEPDSDCQSDETPRPPFRKPQSFTEEWVGGLQDQEDPGEEADPEDAGEETLSAIGLDEEPIHLPNLAEYELFISESRAYRWLLSIIESHFDLEARGENRMASIGDDIRSQLLSHPSLRKVSRAAPPATVKALFSLNWNPLQFFAEQEYDLLPGEVFDHVVCLTGTFQQAQAMTIAEYLEQTWPQTYEPLQYLLRKGLSTPSSSKYEYTLQNGWTLTFQQNVSSCTVEAIGQVDFVSEIGEQLAWVAATLRSSPVSNGVLACVPKLTPRLALYVDRRDAMLILDCQMDFEMTADHGISRHSPGFCWAGLFCNPLLVTNYPIRRRDEVDTGLEMSLSMMAELVRSRQLVSFGGRMILKGFCSLLMATAVANDVGLWHLFYNPTGERISYCDPRLEGIKYGIPEEFALKDLEGRRHIVGWCSNIVESFGLPDANLSIGETNLPIPSKSIVIEKLYIEGGGPVVGGLMIALGKRAKPVHLTRGTTLSDLLDWVADQAVVFYDVDNRRSWLVDGASALLYLVRASIERDRDRPAYRTRWKFNGLLKGSSAMEILCDPDNLDTTIYIDGKRQSASGTRVDVVHLFRDRVQDVLRYLEALIDSQVQSTTQDGYWIRKSDASPTKTAVGFDFWDVAKPPKYVYERVHSLRTPGHGWVHGWVDYIRSIGALIIFGNDFGELIRPRSANGLCPGWKTVPNGAELMCCTIRTLKFLQEAKGASGLGPGELTSGIIWSSRRQLFEPCPCLALQTSAAASSHVDPVQFLLPKNKLGQLDVTQACVRITLGDLGDLGNDGATVFGHIPYHKTRPKLGYSRSNQEQASSGNGSNSGTSQDTTEDASVIGLPKHGDRIPESRPRNPLKKLWDAFLRT